MKVIRNNDPVIIIVAVVPVTSVRAGQTKLCGQWFVPSEYLSRNREYSTVGTIVIVKTLATR